MATLNEQVVAAIVSQKLEGATLLFVDAHPLVFEQLTQIYQPWTHSCNVATIIQPCLNVHGIPVYRLDMQSDLRFVFSGLAEEFVELQNVVG